MSAQLRRSLRPSKPTAPRVYIVGIVLIAVVAGFVAWKLSFRDDPRTALSPDTTPGQRESGSETTTVSAQHTAVADLLARARAEAKNWNPRAQLVWLKASPVRSGWVDLHGGGQLIATFGASKPGGFPNPTELSDGQLIVTITRDELSSLTKSTSQHRFFHTDRTTLDPVCTGYAAFQNLSRARDLDDVSMTLSYGTSKKHQRPVWMARAQNDLVTLDGSSCAILTR